MPRISRQDCLDALTDWAAAEARTGPLTRKRLDRWCRRNRRPSVTTVIKRLAPPEGPATLPAAIDTNLKHVAAAIGTAPGQWDLGCGHPSGPETFADWWTVRDDCVSCAREERERSEQREQLRAARIAAAGGTIAERHPDLLEQLWDRTHGSAPADTPVRWATLCHRPGQRHPVPATAAQVLAGDTRCYWCEQLDELDQVGQLLPARRTAARAPVLGGPRHPGPGPGATGSRSKAEDAIGHRLRDAGIDCTWGQRLILPPHSPLPTRWITPDIAIPTTRTLIEIDGAGPHSRHATPEGLAQDQNRDTATHQIGWTTIRLRHPDLPPISTTATILICDPARTTRATRTILDALHQAKTADL